jgi:hypothetical protein
MIRGVEPLHITEGDLARDLIRPAEPVRRKISECIALMPADSDATIDPDFAKDVDAAISAHREPLEPPAWD